MADARGWMARAQLSLSFSMAFTPLVFLSSDPLSLLLVPYCLLATYRVLAYASAHHASHPLWRSHGERALQYLIANRHRVLAFNAQLEVVLGFYCLYRLFTPSRSFIAAFYMVRRSPGRARAWGRFRAPWLAALLGRQ
jgi:hypothetical protein